MSFSEKVHTVSSRWWFAIRDSNHKSQSQSNLDTEYDRTKVPPYNGNDPRLPLVV